MTKAQEIAILHKCAADLGKDSYAGPWLNEQLPQIERAIRSDVGPEIFALSHAEAFREGKAIVERANAEARAVLDKAAADADRIRQQADAYATRIREDLREHLRGLIGKV